MNDGVNYLRSFLVELPLLDRVQTIMQLHASGLIDDDEARVILGLDWRSKGNG